MAKNRKKRSKGAGDTVNKITEVTGIKKLVKWLFGEDCGCKERQEYLNKTFPYKFKCLNESEYLWWTEYRKRHNPKSFTRADVVEISKIVLRVLSYQIVYCGTCSSSIKAYNKAVGRINTIYDSYET